MKAVIEGILFLSGNEGITLEQIQKITKFNMDSIKENIQELYNDYINNKNRGIQIEFLGNRYKLTTKKEHKEYYKNLLFDEEYTPLTQSSLETLAIIAYNCPITRVDIDEIRGVNSSYIVRKLLLKGLIEEVGKSDAPGKPILYNVTNKFLDYFGLGTINDLPQIKENETNEKIEKSLFESKYIDE